MNGKTVLAFVMGVGIGALTARFVLKEKYENEYYLKVNSMMGAKAECSATRPDPDRKVLVMPQHRYKKIAHQYGRPNEEGPDENPCEKVWEEQEQYERHERLSVGADGSNADDHADGPYIINVEQFTEEMGHFDKCTLDYYEDDETLAEQNGEIVDDVAGTVGRDALSRFGEGSDDDEIVYVRNEKLGIDYEVIRLSKSYAETMGIPGRREH